MKLSEIGSTTPRTMKLSEIDDIPPKPKSFLDKAGEVGMETAGVGLTAAGVGAGAYLAGKALSKGGNLVARVGANLTQKTLDTVKQEGFSKVKAISDKGGEYFANKSIPEARRNVIKSIINGNADALDIIGFNPDEVNSIKNISKGRLKAFGSQISNNWTTMSKNLVEVTQKVGKKIGNVYDVAANIGVDFSVPKTFGVIKGELKALGLVNMDGSIIQNAEKAIPSPGIGQLLSVYEELNSSIKGKGSVTVPQFRNYMARIEAAVGKDEKFNVPLYKVARVLRSEAADAINPSAKLRGLDIVKLNREYSENIAMQNLGDKLNKVINDAPEALEATFKKVKNDFNTLSRQKFEKIYGTRFIKDVDLISAARELYPEKAGGITRYGIRQAVKGGMVIRDVAGKVGKSIRGVLPVISDISSAADYASDPEAWMMKNEFGIDPKNLAPKGSLERKIQLRQVI